MTYPRAHLVDPEGGVYHVCSRCVRRAWLCGTDETGYNYDHRRQWLEDRILQLSSIFAVDLYGYAVMSNHYHIVLNVDPSKQQDWTDEDVSDKWIALFPQQPSHPNAEELTQIRKSALLTDPDRLAVLRERLTSLSWFMRCLNEPLARLANVEDHCKGRFWEGRFDSQSLLDDNAILASMVYVDLNPVRAGIATDIVDAEHTSLRKRVTEQSSSDIVRSINSPHESLPFTYSINEYIELARWTALTQQSKRPLSKLMQLMLAQPNAPNPKTWFTHFLPQPGRWQRAIGSTESLEAYASNLGQRWIRRLSVSL